MSNPFNALNPYNSIDNNKVDNMRNIYQILTQSKNPMQTFQELAMQNPQLQPIVNMLRSGINPQQIFINMCNQRGINPQDFLKKISG